MTRYAPVVASLAIGLVASLVARAAVTDIVVGYQRIYNPWKAAIADGEFERATGRTIVWKRFDSGAQVVAAMDEGAVDLGVAGSSAIAGGASRGLPVALFWIAEDIGAAEALVVRDGAGIVMPQDLRGKRLGAPFGSTAHFHTLFALSQFGMAPEDVDLRDMQPPALAAAWNRGEIDAAFVWEPALGQLVKTGRVLIASDLLSRWGKATFDGMIVRKPFADANRGFMCRFVATLAAADDRYRSDPESFAPGRDNARKVADIAGGDHNDVKAALDLYTFPTLEEQASARWLGSGAEGGASRALYFTSAFLLEQKTIDTMLPDYGAAIDDSFLKAALSGC